LHIAGFNAILDIGRRWRNWSFYTVGCISLQSLLTNNHIGNAWRGTYEDYWNKNCSIQILDLQRRFDGCCSRVSYICKLFDL